MKTHITSRHRFGVGPQAVVLLLVLALAGATAIGPTRKLLEQRSRIAGMSAELDRIELSNEQLEDRIVRLGDPDYLEQQAREQSELVLPGETSYIVMPPKQRGRNERGGAKGSGDAAPPREPGFIEGFLDFLGVR